MRRGEVYRFWLPTGVGHEQHGNRYGVVVPADELLSRSVVVVAPTSRRARPASFRPEADGEGQVTGVLVEHSAPPARTDSARVLATAERRTLERR